MTTQNQPAVLFVTFVGGLENGFHAVKIDDKSETERLWYKNEARRVHSQYIKLQDPAEAMPGFQADRSGDVVVFVGDTFGGNVYGPFAVDSQAAAFGPLMATKRGLSQGSFRVFQVQK